MWQHLVDKDFSRIPEKTLSTRMCHIWQNLINFQIIWKLCFQIWKHHFHIWKEGDTKYLGHVDTSSKTKF